MIVFFGKNSEEISLRLFRTLLDLGADPLQVNKAGYNVVHLSANLGFSNYLEELIKRNIDMNQLTSGHKDEI